MQSDRLKLDDPGALASAEQHLRTALSEDPDSETSYHIREALQLLIAKREL